MHFSLGEKKQLPIPMYGLGWGLERYWRLFNAWLHCWISLAIHILVLVTSLAIKMHVAFNTYWNIKRKQLSLEISTARL